VAQHDDAPALLLVTHSSLAASYGDRTVALRDGRIVRDVGTMDRNGKAIRE